VDDRLVEAALSIDPPEVLHRDALASDLLELLNTRYFGVLRFQLRAVEENLHELVIETPPTPHTRSQLQLGIGFLDDFD
jgi:hypothetical protein